MRDNADWKKQFGIFLKRFFDKYDLDYSCFAEKYHWSTSTIRYWFIGRSLPQRKGILNIKEYLSNNIPCNSRQDEQIYFSARERRGQHHVPIILCQKKCL